MLKKMLAAVFALGLGALAAEARDVVTLGLYTGEGCSIQLAGELPKGVTVGKPKKTKSGLTSTPYHINLEKTQAAELTFKVSGTGKFYASLNPIRVEKDKKRQSVPVKCNTFEFNGESAIKAPFTLTKWRRMITRDVKDGDTVTFKAEFEKVEEQAEK